MNIFLDFSFTGTPFPLNLSHQIPQYIHTLTVQALPHLHIYLVYFYCFPIFNFPQYPDHLFSIDSQHYILVVLAILTPSSKGSSRSTVYGITFLTYPWSGPVFAIPTTPIKYLIILNRCCVLGCHLYRFHYSYQLHLTTNLLQCFIGLVHYLRF